MNKNITKQIPLVDNLLLPREISFPYNLVKKYDFKRLKKRIESHVRKFHQISTELTLVKGSNVVRIDKPTWITKQDRYILKPLRPETGFKWYPVNLYILGFIEGIKFVQEQEELDEGK